MALGNEELMHECFPKEQERNKIKKQTKTVRREAWVWKEVQRARKKIDVKGNLLNEHMCEDNSGENER